MDLKQAVDRLAKFKTTRGLADFLRREGHTGHHGGLDCPLHSYFDHVVASTGSIYVVPSGVKTYVHGGVAEFILFPDVVTRFVHEYDHKKRFKFLALPVEKV